MLIFDITVAVVNTWKVHATKQLRTPMSLLHCDILLLLKPRRRPFAQRSRAVDHDILRSSSLRRHLKRCRRTPSLPQTPRRTRDGGNVSDQNCNTASCSATRSVARLSLQRSRITPHFETRKADQKLRSHCKLAWNTVNWCQTFVCLSVCLSVCDCSSPWCVVQKRLNRSRRRLWSD